jgi:TusA-related sulfurtransferase
MDSTVEIDTRGLNCPLPVLKAQKAIRGMDPGTRLRCRTDPRTQRLRRFLRDHRRHLKGKCDLGEHFVW